MQPRSALVSALIFAGVLSAATPSFAYCRSTTCVGDCPRDDAGCKTTGTPLQWPAVCVGFSLQRDGSEHIPIDVLRATVQDSFAAWADIDCGAGALASIGLAELDDITCQKSEYDKSGPNANAIIVQDTKWDYHGPYDTLAKTTVTFDPSTGQILDADIEINHAYNEITTGEASVVYDLRSILTHEIGHFLGLDHTDDPAATMYADYEPGSTEQRSLEDDDTAGLCAVYPPGRAGVCDATPRGGLADYCKGETPAKDAGGGCDIASPSVPQTGTLPGPGTPLFGLALAASLALFRRHTERRNAARRNTAPRNTAPRDTSGRHTSKQKTT